MGMVVSKSRRGHFVYSIYPFLSDFRNWYSCPLYVPVNNNELKKRGESN